MRIKNPWSGSGSILWALDPCVKQAPGASREVTDLALSRREGAIVDSSGLGNVLERPQGVVESDAC